MKILIVDDNEMLVTVVSAILRMAGHLEFSIARDGVEGLRKCLDERPDMVLLDWVMPRMDGYEVCAAIKADPLISATRVVIMTAAGKRTDSERAFEVGADAYLTKPFSPRDLLSAMQPAKAAA